MTVTVPRSDILELVYCADSYGFGDDVLFCTFAEWLQTIPSAEIEAYAQDLADTDGYGEEDKDSAIKILRKFKLKYESSGQLKAQP